MKKEKPILFSTPMIQALLNNDKTMTRRVVKDKHILYMLDETKCLPSYCAGLDFCPYGQVGDHLWVRETWLWNDEIGVPYAYKADYNEEYQKRMKGHWKPSIHMFRDAARIFLEITEIRIERLHDISESDCKNEGIEWKTHFGGRETFKNYMIDRVLWNAKASFKTLWISINEKKYPWKSNPWVWVVKFKVIEK